VSLRFNWTEHAPEGEKPVAQLALARALAIAAAAHHDDFDGNGEPILLHAIRVAGTMARQKPWDRSGILVGLLHDACEGQGEATLRQPEDGGDAHIMAGGLKLDLSRREYDALVLLKRVDQRFPYQDYIRRLAMDPLAISVKLADLNDNLQGWRMRKLDKQTRARLTVRYLAARRYLQEVQLSMKNWQMA
jgi:(p)ppGpp synthase/HD superfamily hydrolase